MRSQKEFTDILCLSGKKFQNQPLDTVVHNIHRFSSQIWEGPRLYKYVDHGIEHSYQVVRKCNDLSQVLPEKERLSALERSIVGVASLLHDIGLQYNKYPKDKKQFTDEDVRKNHTRLGYYMLMDALEAQTERERALPDLSREEYHRLITYWAGLVGFSHTGRIYWDKLKDFKYTESEGEYKRRLGLLGALLRLADELHCEYTRVKEPNLITSEILNAEEKSHWVACYYTHTVEFYCPGDGGGLNITMNWRVPLDAEDEEVSLIRSLLVDLREKKINQEIQVSKEYFRWSDGRECPIIEFILAEEPERAKIKNLPGQVKEFIEKQLRPYQYRKKILVSYPNFNQVTGGTILHNLQKLAYNFAQSEQGFEEGHFSLKTGWHTDKYIKCRELVSNQQFVKDLAVNLKEFYSELNITDILAIGTSSIMIGSLLSLHLKANLSFTFEEAKILKELHTKIDYSEYEKAVYIQPESRLLIIDDIFGVGSVIKKVVQELKSKNPPAYIRAFVLYSLGDIKDIIYSLTEVKIDYLASIPDIKYYKVDENTGLCKECKDKPEILEIEG